ncbi:MAG: hypothetical protein JWL95_121 [Gemmatimonadetes bacterium]|nr:hypothetical protein [Gemmatimonadota bacterium]
MFVNSLRSHTARWSTLVAIAGGVLVLGAARPSARTSAAKFGGPWISIETPVNPFDNSTRGALLLVHTFHHGTPEDMPIVGKAEGLVDGQRRSVAFTVAKSSRTGTYGVHKQWGDKGIWTLLITATPLEHQSSIQAVVDIGADGEVERVSVPRNAQSMPRMLTAAEVDRGLRERAKGPVAVGAR